MTILHPFQSKKESVVLHGTKVFLRSPEFRDWREWSELRKFNMEYLKPWEPAWSPYELERGYFVKRVKFFDKLSNRDKAYSFLIFDSDKNKLIGEININNIQRGVVQSCSIGYWISENKMGLGYMRESISILKDFIFNDLKLHRVEAACLPRNMRSLRTLLKSEFEIEGHAKKYLKINGVWEDHILLSFIKHESI